MDHSDAALRRAVMSSDQIFIARVSGFRELSPEASGTGQPERAFNEMDWTLIEALKGAPPLSGVLAEPRRLPSDGVPPPACGPFTVTAYNQDRDMLILISMRTRLRPGTWLPSYHSAGLMQPDKPGSTLSRVRHLIREQQDTP